jgi:hypothetical protein
MRRPDCSVPGLMYRPVRIEMRPYPYGRFPVRAASLAVTEGVEDGQIDYLWRRRLAGLAGSP